MAMELMLYGYDGRDSSLPLLIRWSRDWYRDVCMCMALQHHIVSLPRITFYDSWRWCAPQPCSIRGAVVTSGSALFFQVTPAFGWSGGLCKSWNGGIWNDGFYCCVGQNSSDFMWAWDARRRYEISNDNVLECRRSKDDTIKIVKILFVTGYYCTLYLRFAVYGHCDGCSWTNKPMLKIYDPHGQVDRVECDCSRASNSKIWDTTMEIGVSNSFFCGLLI